MKTLTRNLKQAVTRLVTAAVVVGALTGVAAGAATGAVVAPSVTTGAVSSVTSSSAVVNGTVDPNGSATTWYVEYGLTTSYGSKTAAESAGSSGATSVSVKISGLQPETTYHYNVVALNAGGTVTGGDGILSTLGKPVATTGVVNELGATELRFTGIVQPNGQPTDYYFQFGTTTSFGTRTTSESAGSGSGSLAVQVLVSNLTPSTTYDYRLVATSSGTTVYGNVEHAATASDVSLQAASATITYGASDLLSGVVADHGAGETVGIVAEPTGSSAFSGIGTTTTTTGGAWSFMVSPALLTEYEVGVSGGDSPPIAVSVRPTVTLSSVAQSRFATRISAGIPFAGRIAQVQRLVHNTWTLVRHFVLGAGGRAVIPMSWIPSGSSDVRVAIGVNVTGANQAGLGYLAGISNAIPFRK